MTSANEAAQGRTALGAALKAGVDTLSLNQEIEFTLYIRMVLPADGYVFWVRATSLSPSALLNAFKLNASYLNRGQIASPSKQMKVMGSLHYTTEIQQEASSSVAVNRVIFTSEDEVQDFNAVGPDMMYIATFDGIRFAFSQRQSWYQQADLWHLVGHAIYSTMDSQIIDNPALFYNRLIVSNSLPAWLAINQRTVPWLPFWETPQFQLYPSYLVPLNLPPIYGVVHVTPDRTEAAQTIPFLDSRYNHQQLARDHVEITLYGCSNDLASNFFDMVIDYMSTEAPMGLMNTPIIRDRKKIQPELLILAQEKTIEFEVSYNQAAMRDLPRQLILEAFIDIIPMDEFVEIPITPKPPVANKYVQAVNASLSYIKSQIQTRTVLNYSTLRPDDPTQNRHTVGSWTGQYSAPGPYSGPPYSPVFLLGPLYFPIQPGVMVDFSGRVDYPFFSMDGLAGRRDMINPTPPPNTITNPATVYADGGINWGKYFIVGSVDGVTQFITPTLSNASWAARVDVPPAGNWTFQLITYANSADANADVNRIAVGHPWNQFERPGDIRQYYNPGYIAQSPQFTNVVVGSGATPQIALRVQPFTQNPAYTYQILVTVQTDVEYAQILYPITGPGAYLINSPQAFGGPVKLRLVEQLNGCSINVVGQVWAQENAAVPASWPDLAVYFYHITDFISSIPDAIQPAYTNGTWNFTLSGDGSVGKVALVNLNTKRVYGEYTMPTGLMRSFIVPPDQAGQNTTSVYYEGFLDTCFLYDQAVCLIAYLQMGERLAAENLVDALLTVQAADGAFPFATQQAALYGANTGFIRNGGVAWVAYALLLCDQPQFRSWFSTSTRAAAESCLAFLDTYTNAIGTINGGKGQYVNGVLDPNYVVPWWSTEHNIDYYWCLKLADALYGSATVNYAGRAAAVKQALLTDGQGWDAVDGIFWQGGTVTAGVNTPDGQHALDMYSWGGILQQLWGRIPQTLTGLQRAYNYYWCTAPNFNLSGYTTFVPQDGYPPDTVKSPWYEGSFGVALCKRTLSTSDADSLLDELVKAQLPNGSYLYALARDPVQDINPWPCIIAPAWNIVAYSGAGTPYTRVLWPLS